MNRKYLFRVTLISLLLVAITVMAVAAQGMPTAPQKAQPAIAERGESASPAANVNESEPNNSFATADFIDVYAPDVMSGKINPSDDQDYFHVIPDEEDSRFDWVIDIDTDSAASPLDTYICVFDHDRVEVACNDDSDGVDSLLFVTFSEWPTDFYIQVR